MWTLINAYKQSSIVGGTMPKRDLAILVGNGVSTAFNADLRLNIITKKLVKRIGRENDSPEAVIQAMRKIADRHSRIGRADYDDFESIVGAFLGESRTLEDLNELAALVDPENTELSDAIARSANFAGQVRDTGTSHVLEIIFEKSRAREAKMGDLRSLVRTIVSSFDGEVTFGNLNYDTLLLSALLAVCPELLADLGHGLKRGSIQTGEGPNAVTHRFPRLRTALDMPNRRRVRLFHLHGSLVYWRKPNGDHFKLTTEFLDEYRPWSSVRANTTPMRPAVVLANQSDKTGLVAEYPFSLAYKGFAVSLDRTSHWLIMGYSFRDECVNDLLREKFHDYEDPVAVLVVTKGTGLSRRTVETAFGWAPEMGSSKHWLSIARDGATGIAASKKWQRFTS